MDTPTEDIFNMSQAELVDHFAAIERKKLEAQLAEVKAAHELDCQLKDKYRWEVNGLKIELQHIKGVADMLAHSESKLRAENAAAQSKIKEHEDLNRDLVFERERLIKANDQASAQLAALSSALVKTRDALKDISNHSGGLRDPLEVHVGSLYLTDKLREIHLTAKEALALTPASCADDSAKLREDEIKQLKAEILRLHQNYVATVTHIEGPHSWAIKEPGTWIFLTKIFTDGSGMVHSIKRVEAPVLEHGEEPIYPCKEWREFHQKHEKHVMHYSYDEYKAARADAGAKAT